MDLLLLHLAATWALVGLIWTVQLVQYPGFLLVGRPDFAAYHEHHASRITWIVGPLMGTEGLTGLALFWADVPGLSTPFLTAGFALIVLNAAWTAFVAVPLHGSLGGRAEANKRRLVTTNWVRTAAWSARGVWTLVAVRAALAAS